MRISDWSSDVCSSDLGAEHRGQYIVEIMRDTARELADRLHLRRLRDLALEARFLARILEAEQHRRLAQPAHSDDAHRYRIAALPRETGRASCRERVCQYVSITVVAVSYKQKEIKKTQE